MRHFTDDLAQPSVPTTGSSTFPGIAQTSDQQSDHKAEKVIKKWLKFVSRCVPSFVLSWSCPKVSTNVQSFCKEKLPKRLEFVLQCHEKHKQISKHFETQLLNYAKEIFENTKSNQNLILF
jgi:hypothetical protein